MFESPCPRQELPTQWRLLNQPRSVSNPREARDGGHLANTCRGSFLWRSADVRDSYLYAHLIAPALV